MPEPEPLEPDPKPWELTDEDYRKAISGASLYASPGPSERSAKAAQRKLVNWLLGNNPTREVFQARAEEVLAWAKEKP